MINWDVMIPNLISNGIAVTTVVLSQLRNRHKAIKERAQRDQEISDAQDKRHKENQDKLTALIKELEFLPPHGHQEVAGTLRASGIIPLRRKPNGQ